MPLYVYASTVLPFPKSIVAVWAVSVKDLIGATLGAATNFAIGVGLPPGVPICMPFISIPGMFIPSIPDELMLMLSGITEWRAVTKNTLPNTSGIAD